MSQHKPAPEYSFEVFAHRDNTCGVFEYQAFRTADFQKNGIPKVDSLSGRGDTPWEAIADLCEKLDKKCEEVGREVERIIDGG